MVGGEDVGVRESRSGRLRRLEDDFRSRLCGSGSGEQLSSKNERRCLDAGK